MIIFTQFLKNDFVLIILQIVLLDSARTLFLVKTVHHFGGCVIIFIGKLYFVCVSNIFSLYALNVLLFFNTFFSFHILLWRLNVLVILNVFDEDIVVFEHTLFAFFICMWLILMRFLFTKLTQIVTTDVYALLLETYTVSECGCKWFIQLPLYFYASRRIVQLIPRHFNWLYW